jgi:hypothetical protein
MSQIRLSVAAAADRLVGILAFGYIVLLPWSWPASRLHIQGSDAVFVLLVAAVLASNGLRRISLTALDAAVLVYVAGLALSLVAAPEALRGLSELAKTLYLVLVYFVFSTIVRDHDRRRRVAAWIALSSVAWCGFGLVYAAAHSMWSAPAAGLGRDMNVPYLGQVLRLSLGLATPELLGDYLTYAIPFVLGCFLSRETGRPGPKSIAAMISVGVAEWLTFSHSWAGFVTAALIFCWTRWATPLWMRLRWLLAIAACVLAIAINLASIVYVHDVSLEHRTVPAPVALPEHVVETDQWPQIHLTATYNYLHYFALKTVAWNAFRSHPIAGLGLGHFHEATEHAYGLMTAACRACMPHSTLLGHLAETGLVGTGALLLLWIAVVLAARRALARAPSDDDQWIMRAALAGGVGLIVNGLNADIMHFRFLWILIAFVRAGAAPRDGMSARVV